VTVIGDESEPPHPTLSPSRRKSERYRKPRLLAPSVPSPTKSKTTGLNPWTRLGRRSINPKIPDENQAEVEKETLVSTRGQAPPIPITSSARLIKETLEESPPQDPDPLGESPNDKKDRDSDTGQVLRTLESNVSMEREKSRDPPPSPTENPMIGKRSSLSLSLIRTAQKLLEAQPIPPSPNPFTSVEKPTTQEKHDFLQRKSYSTPRKRRRHVRNLQFKTPPSLRVESPSDHTDFFNERDTGNETREEDQVPRVMRSKKKLDWDWTFIRGSSAVPVTLPIPLENIPEQEEASFTNETNGMMETSALERCPVPAVAVAGPGPPPSSWFPPSTPKPHILSPQRQDTSAWESPPKPHILSPQRQHATGWESPAVPKVPWDHNYFASLHTLQRLLGSPLHSGYVPSTPGRNANISTNEPSSTNQLQCIPPLPKSQPTATIRKSNTLAPAGQVATEDEELREMTLSGVFMGGSSMAKATAEDTEFRFRVPAEPKARSKSGDSDSGKPPKKRRRLPDKNQTTLDLHVEQQTELDSKRAKGKESTQLPPPSHSLDENANNGGGCPRILRSLRKSLGNLELTSSIPRNRKSAVLPLLPPGIPDRILALQKTSIPFPEYVSMSLNAFELLNIFHLYEKDTWRVVREFLLSFFRIRFLHCPPLLIGNV